MFFITLFLLHILIPHIRSRSPIYRFLVATAVLIPTFAVSNMFLMSCQYKIIIYRICGEYQILLLSTMYIYQVYYRKVHSCNFYQQLIYKLAYTLALHTLTLSPHTITSQKKIWKLKKIEENWRKNWRKLKYLYNP